LAKAKGLKLRQQKTFSGTLLSSFCLGFLPSLLAALPQRRTAMKQNRSYILRIESERSVKQFWLQDIKTGERVTFQTWQALKHHLEHKNPSGLK
jgi:asparagine synthetase B (glutamine-hydrolysing)